jgi:hypothetical protein
MKKQFTDRQDISGYDILNIENPHFQTIRKVIHRDDIETNKAYQDAIVKQDCQACLNIPDDVFTADFYRGYAIAEQNYFEGIYRYFEEEHFINREDLDVVFRIKDGAPYLNIHLPDDEDSGGDDEGETPDEPLRPEVKKLKEDLDL